MPFALVLAGYALFFALFFWPAFASGRYLGDAVDQLIEALPLYGFDHPLWDTRTMLGFPMFANATHPYWYPLALLRFVPDSFNAYEWCAFVLAAFGTYGFTRALTGSTFGALLAGFVYALSGFMIGHVGHVDIVHPAAWVRAAERH